MTPAELAAIRKRAENVTVGPWEVTPCGACESRGRLDVNIWGCNGNAHIVGWHDEDEYNPINAQFIAHAREDVPALLAEVERLRARLDKVRALHKPAPVYTTEAGDCEHGGDCEAVEISAGSYCPDSKDGLTCNECANLAEFADDLPAYPCPTIQCLDGSDQ